jgi:hypothetical protein
MIESEKLGYICIYAYGVNAAIEAIFDYFGGEVSGHIKHKKSG